MKTNIKSEIPKEYQKHISFQDIVNLVAAFVVVFLLIIFLGGVMFRTELFESIFWNYLVPTGLFCLGFAISGKLAKSYYKKVIAKKEAAFQKLRQENMKLQEDMQSLVKDLTRANQELKRRNVRENLSDPAEDVSKTAKAKGSIEEPTIIAVVNRKKQ